MNTDGLLILGIGNILMGDDGAGVHLATALLSRIQDLPAGTIVLDGGTLGLELLDDIEQAAAVLVLDAVELGAEPGTVAVLRGDEIAVVFGSHLSPHQVGVADLLAAADLLGVLPPRISLIGIQPGSIGFSLDLSDAVGRAVSEAATTAIAEAWTMVGEVLHA